MSLSPSLEGRVCVIYMIGDEDGYDDDDDGDDVMTSSPSPSLEGRLCMMYMYMMIILPSPLLGKLGTLYVNDMHDFYLNGRRVAISCFDLSCWYPVIFTLCFTYSVHCPY